jgi:hypothetical protein
MVWWDRPTSAARECISQRRAWQEVEPPLRIGSTILKTLRLKNGNSRMKYSRKQINPTSNYQVLHLTATIWISSCTTVHTLSFQTNQPILRKSLIRVEADQRRRKKKKTKVDAFAQSIVIPRARWPCSLTRKNQTHPHPFCVLESTQRINCQDRGRASECHK